MDSASIFCHSFVQYQPWEAFQLAQVNELVLNIRTSSQQRTIQVALWDWSEATWIVDKGIGWGASAISSPARFVGPNNAVRVRIENPTISGYDVDMDITFKGTMQ